MPPPVIIILAVLAALAALTVFILSLRGTLTFAYDGEFKIFFRVLFFKFRIFPFKEKRTKHRVHSMGRWRAKRIRKLVQKREERRSKFNIVNLIRDALTKKDVKEDTAEKKQSKKPEEPKKKGLDFRITADDVSTVLDVLGLTAELAALTVKQFSKRLRIKIARLKVKIASPDAALTAVAYGAATQTVNILLPILDDVKNFDLPKRKNFDVVADFTSTEPEIDMEISFSLRVWHLFDIPIPAITHAVPRLPKYVDKVLDKIKEIKSASSEETSEDGQNNDAS